MKGVIEFVKDIGITYNVELLAKFQSDIKNCKMEKEDVEFNIKEAAIFMKIPKPVVEKSIQNTSSRH